MHWLSNNSPKGVVSGIDVLRRIKRAMVRVVLGPIRRAREDSRVCKEWTKAGKPLPPPPAVKRQVVKQHARRFRIRVFVETGTYLGDMVHAVRNIFVRIYSIELSPDLYRKAQGRFAGCRHIVLIQGDSGKLLKDILQKVAEPCLFWLDGHYSAGETAKGEADTPPWQELSSIAGHRLALRHVILIDDARHFTGQGDYPTVQAIESMARSLGYDRVVVEDDIIRIHASRHAGRRCWRG